MAVTMPPRPCEPAEQVRGSGFHCPQGLSLCTWPFSWTLPPLVADANTETKRGQGHSEPLAGGAPVAETAARRAHSLRGRQGGPGVFPPLRTPLLLLPGVQLCSPADGCRVLSRCPAQSPAPGALTGEGHSGAAWARGRDGDMRAAFEAHADGGLGLGEWKAPSR